MPLPPGPRDPRRAGLRFQSPRPEPTRFGGAARLQINPWDGLIYSCFGGGDIHEFFIHERKGPRAGRWTGRAITLNPPVKHVQGACFSPNGHLYIATNAKLPGKPKYQTIWYYSALNGHQFGVIPVLAEQAEDDDPADSLSQELEGICFGNVIAPNGRPAQIHAVLLENQDIALDDLFLKSFASSTPDLV